MTAKKAPAKKVEAAAKKRAAAPRAKPGEQIPPEPQPGDMTVGDVKIQWLIERQGQQEAKHTQELMEQRVQHLMERQQLLQRIAELEGQQPSK